MKALLALTAAMLVAAPAYAYGTNLGFEDGINGWTASSGNGFATGNYGAFSPVSGDAFGAAAAGDGAYVYTTLSQLFHLAAGGTISGYVGFQAGDYLPYNDDGFLTVNGSPIFVSNIATVGDYGNTGWQTFSFTAPTYGDYTLTFGSRNLLDNCCGGTATVVDNVVLTGEVPEPATWTMLIGGFGMVGFAARRRQAALAA